MADTGIKGADSEPQGQSMKKMSAIDLIKSNFDFIQNQYREDYEKQELIGYEEALVQIDDFVNQPPK